MMGLCRQIMIPRFPLTLLHFQNLLKTDGYCDTMDT